MQQGNKKPTLKEILERHHIELLEVYEKCSAPLTEIEVFYENNIGIRSELEKVLQTVNRLKKEKGDSTEDYTLDSVSIRYIYGSSS